jgi:hypothetical protein
MCYTYSFVSFRRYNTVNPFTSDFQNMSAESSTSRFQTRDDVVADFGCQFCNEHLIAAIINTLAYGDRSIDGSIGRYTGLSSVPSKVLIPVSSDHSNYLQQQQSTFHYT